MECCCPADREPLYGAYVNNLQSVRAPAQRSKFSFRTTAAASERSRSRLSRDDSDDQEHLLDQELRRLEDEYARLAQEEAEIDHFQHTRVRLLEQEVAFYEHEIRERTRDIDELNQLFRAKLQQRHLQNQHLQERQLQERQVLSLPPPSHALPPSSPPPAQLVHLGFMKTGDDTSISSIQPNS